MAQFAARSATSIVQAQLTRGADRIRLDEVVQLARDLESEPIVARQPVGLSEQRPMLASRQLPRQLDVGAPGPHLRRGSTPRAERRAESADPTPDRDTSRSAGSRSRRPRDRDRRACNGPLPSRSNSWRSTRDAASIVACTSSGMFAAQSIEPASLTLTYRRVSTQPSAHPLVGGRRRRRSVRRPIVAAAERRRRGRGAAARRNRERSRPPCGASRRLRLPRFDDQVPAGQPLDERQQQPQAARARAPARSAAGRS